MRQFVGVLGLSSLLLVPGVLWAQGAPAPTCEAQVLEHYTALTKDPQLLPGPAPLEWPQQLSAISGQVREVFTRYEIKRNQADLAEKNIAQLLEQLRQAQAQSAALRQEVEQLKAAAPPRN